MSPEEAWNWLSSISRDRATGQRDVTVMPIVIRHETNSHLQQTVLAQELVWGAGYVCTTHMSLYANAARSELKRREQRKQRPITGYVYLLQSPTGYYKIGRTINPESRLQTFGIQLPFEVDYLCLIQTPDMRGLEQELHERFAIKRANGEWFALDQHDIDYIRGLA